MRVILLVLVVVFLVQDHCLAIQSGGGAPWTAKEMEIISKKISTIVKRPKDTWNQYMKLHPNETVYQIPNSNVFQKKVKSLSKSFKNNLLYVSVYFVFRCCDWHSMIVCLMETS